MSFLITIRKPIQVEDGQIMRSTVTSIERGSHGNPGEKLARFSPDREVIGNITINSPFGIFGKLNTNMTNGVMDKAMPIALSHQVKEGPAKILTVIDQIKWKRLILKLLVQYHKSFRQQKAW